MFLAPIRAHRTARAALPAAASLTVLLALAACSSDEEGDGELSVATTVAPITSIAANIGGDRVDIEGIVPEGTNSHTFEPAPQVAELLSTADIVLINGLQLEEPTKDLAEQNMKDGAVLIELGDEVLPEEDYIFDFSFPEEDGKPNPHLWTDPTYAVEYAEVITETFSEQDPDNADYYSKNLAAFTKKADALADALRADQESVPEGNLKLVTYHDAYAYFAETFGWTVVGALQPNSFEDPTPAEVALLIDQVNSEGVTTIFGSEVFPSAVLEEIGRATDVRYEDTLRDDDLPGEPGEPDHSWLGLMRYNYETMIEGLGGAVEQLPAVDTEDVAPDEAEYPQ